MVNLTKLFSYFLVPFKHTNRISLSTTMGISMEFHDLLTTGLVFLSWENSSPKSEMPPIYCILDG